MQFARCDVWNVESDTVELVVSVHCIKKLHRCVSGLMFTTALCEQAIENLVRTHISTPVRPLVTHSSLHLLFHSHRE